MCLTLTACSKRPAGPTTTQVYDKGKAVVAMLAKGDFAGVTSQFDPTMQKVLPEQQLKAAWDSLVSKNGAFQAQQMVSNAKEGGLDVATVTCQFAQGRQKVKIVFNQQLQISGLWIQPSP